MSSFFERVKHFNKLFGNKVLETPDPTILNNTVLTESCMKLIREEMRELEEAVVNKDYLEVCDAITDSIYVLLGFAARTGLDIDKAFDLVHTNNMQKMCSTYQEACDTVDYYRNHPELGYESPAIRAVGDSNQGPWAVYNESTKKILKSINWKPVDLSSVSS